MRLPTFMALLVAILVAAIMGCVASPEGGQPPAGQLAITPVTLPAGIVGQVYSVTLRVAGGQAPYTWSATPSSAAGLSFDPASATISGTPNTAGQLSVNVGVTDSQGLTTSRDYTLTVNQATPANPTQAPAAPTPAAPAPTPAAPQNCPTGFVPQGGLCLQMTPVPATPVPATSTPVPAATATRPAIQPTPGVAQPPVPAPPASTCPQPGVVWDLVKVIGTKNGTEPCSFHFNTGDKVTYRPIFMAKGYFWTTSEAPNGHIFVQKGDDTWVWSKAATWRHEAEYSGLTLDEQFRRERDFGASQSPRFDAIVFCRGCTDSNTPKGHDPIRPNGNEETKRFDPDPNIRVSAPGQGAAQGTCPTFGGVQTTEIGDGGCKYQGATKTATVPAGWKAFFGVPASWHPSGSPITASVASFYKE